MELEVAVDIEEEIEYIIEGTSVMTDIVVEIEIGIEQEREV